MDWGDVIGSGKWKMGRRQNSKKGGDAGKMQKEDRSWVFRE
jgi:hypothetical protein